MGADKPAKQLCISRRERLFIESSVACESIGKRNNARRVPWLEIARSAPLYAGVIGLIGHEYALTTMLQFLRKHFASHKNCASIRKNMQMCARRTRSSNFQPIICEMLWVLRLRKTAFSARCRSSFFSSRNSRRLRCRLGSRAVKATLQNARASPSANFSIWSRRRASHSRSPSSRNSGESQAKTLEQMAIKSGVKPKFVRQKKHSKNTQNVR